MGSQFRVNTFKTKIFKQMLMLTDRKKKETNKNEKWADYQIVVLYWGAKIAL